MRIEAGKLREFARATYATDERLLSGTVMHPAFLMTARLIWEPAEESVTDEVGFDLSGILHGEEEYLFHADLPAPGDVLHVTTRVADRWEKEGTRSGQMRFALVVNEFRSPDGRLVAEQRTTMIETAPLESA